MNNILNYFNRKHIKKIYINPLPAISKREALQIASFFFKQELFGAGPEIKQFEDEFKQYANNKYALSFAKARVGLYTILKALNIKQGDEVILPAYTCVVVPNALSYHGIIPKYVDIEPKTYNMDVSAVKKAITKKTKAIIAHHIYGQPCNLSELREIARKYNLYLIEDAAQSLGAEYKHKKVGNFGDVAFFSFDYTKNITTGQGGMITTNNKDIYEHILEIQKTYSFPSEKYLQCLLLNLTRIPILLDSSFNILGEPLHHLTNAIDSKTLKILSPSMTAEEMSAAMPAEYRSRMPAVLAIIGRQQLNKIDAINRIRIKNADYFTQELEKMNIAAPVIAEDRTHVFLRYTLRCKNNQEMAAIFNKHQINIGLWFNNPLYPATADMGKLLYAKGSCKQAEIASRQVINLPNHAKMTENDLERVIAVVKRYKEEFNQK
ncbi:DegT/DnrJ/EryC1/StrS family aminotransferase [Candidatus Woesearchaeota archaeon]|nr:DegT/DnrJ/EryC1/StrS family aminotransferase [Candidatus Woesearchaeota archaeon]